MRPPRVSFSLTGSVALSEDGRIGSGLFRDTGLHLRAEVEPVKADPDGAEDAAREQGSLRVVSVGAQEEERHDAKTEAGVEKLHGHVSAVTPQNVTVEGEEVGRGEVVASCVHEGVLSSLGT